MFITVIIAAVAGICLTIAVVGWTSRRLGLPVLETMAWFGLTEHPSLPSSRRRPSR